MLSENGATALRSAQERAVLSVAGHAKHVGPHRTCRQPAGSGETFGKESDTGRAMGDQIPYGAQSCGISRQFHLPAIVPPRSSTRPLRARSIVLSVVPSIL